MSYSAVAAVPTENGSRYMQQLLKHWSHNLAVEYGATSGNVVFPADARGAAWPGPATITLDAGPHVLECKIDATAEGQRDGLKGALARHLDRFAFREAPLAFDWKDI